MLSFSLPKKGPFTILQLTDLHLTHGMEADEKTLKMIADLTTHSKPDLLVLTGDIFTDNEEYHPVEMDYACKAFDALNTPWALVMGNHEGNYQFGKGIRERKGRFVRENSKNALFDHGPEAIYGVGNYAIGVHDENAHLVWTLFMIDSNNSAFYKVNGRTKTCEDHIRQDQITWYRQTSDKIKKTHGDVPALAFFHIPLPEYTDAWLFEPCLGDRFEHVTAATINSGFFSAAVEQGDIKGMFAGHDHTNSFSADVFGIKLAYGRCTSYHCNLGNFPRGGRVIVLQENVFETYNLLHIRPEDRVNGGPLAYRQQENESASYYNRFNFCLPLHR